MNTNDSTNTNTEATDDQVLRGVRSHLAGVEDHVPAAPAWRGAPAGSRSLSAVHVRSRVRFSIPPLLVVAALIVTVIGVSLGLRQYGPAGPGAVPTTSIPGALVNITYRLVTADGRQPSAAELTEDAGLLSKRLSFFFPTMVVAAGSRVSGQGTGYEVIALPPDQIVVRFEADYYEVAGDATLDAAWLRSSLGLTGVVEMVGLPASVYGTTASAGPRALPRPGSVVVDPAILVSASDIGGAGFPSSDSTTTGTYLGINLEQAAARRLADYTATNVGGYLAVLVDGLVLATTPISAPITDGTLKFSVGAGLSAGNAATIHFLLANGPALPVPVALIDYTLTGPSPRPAVTAPNWPPTPILSGSPPAGSTPTAVPAASTPAYIQGSTSAPVTLDVWLDYQCTACKTFHDQVLPAIVADYVASGQVKIVFHDFIVIDGSVGGTESRDAANAARCAADQGKYEAYRDLLFATQGVEGSGTFTKARLIDLGVQLGLDRTSFVTCVNSGAHDADVKADSAAAGTRGLIGVPSVAVDGQLLNTHDIETIRQAIDSALYNKAQAASAAPSVSAEP
jgi:protein-disulfide isomerase